MQTYKLPPGTIVKHGTDSSRLASIFQFGLGSTEVSRASFREISEAQPVSQGVYVGEFLAYFGAYASFAAHMSAKCFFVMNEYMKAEGIPDVVQNSSHFIEDLTGCWPIVLRIKPDNPIEIVADEDFVEEENPSHDVLKSKAEEVWRTYRTGCVVEPSHLPAHWIVGIEYPDPRMLLGKQTGLRAEILKKDCMKNWAHDAALLMLGYEIHLSKETHEYALNRYANMVNFSNNKDGRGAVSLSKHLPTQVRLGSKPPPIPLFMRNEKDLFMRGKQLFEFLTRFGQKVGLPMAGNLNT